LASAFLLIRLGAFLAVPLAYWLADLLNYSQAGKTTTLGLFAVLAVACWRLANRVPPSRAAVAVDAAVALPFFIILAIEAFLRDYFGTGPDDALVTEAVFNSNSAETSEFVEQNARALIQHAALLTGAVAFYAAAVWLSARWLGRRARGQAAGPRRRGYAVAAAVFTGLFLLAHLNPSLRRADPFLYVPLRYAKWHERLEVTRELQRKLAATQDDPGLQSMRCDGCGPRTVVFVLGESTTRLNWSLYGYPRETTPELEAVSSDVIKFDDVVTGYPGTEGSVRYIFTPATISQPDLWMTQPDLITIAGRAGYKTFWLSNQGTRSGIISIIASHADVVEFTNRGSSRGEGSYDEVLLPVLQKALDDPAPRKLIVLHMLGAHPVYHFRYPPRFARFDSIYDSVSRQLLTEGRAFWAVILRNEYDNAMLYEDHLLRKTLEMVRGDASSQPTAWLYTPDHGEDVAHYTNFVGHNQHAKSMFEVPMLAWTSNDFDLQAVDRGALAKRPYQLDVLDHSLLGLMKVVGRYYDPRHDIFARAFHPSNRTMGSVPYP
jgi:heptose-I-phosphate ethanolaminephosphotransferase